MRPSRCPNRECESRKEQSFRYAKKGYYITKHNAQPVPRYRCSDCRRYFSSHTFRKSYRQKKPQLNQLVYRMYASAMTQRRIAKVLKINRKTVVRKFLFMSRLSKRAHFQELREGRLTATEIQFDEMESFEHTRLKPLSIALAVAKDSSRIIDVAVASSPMKGKLARVALLKYGYRKDERPRARKKVLKTIRRHSPKPLVITTDSHPAYPRMLKQVLPEATHRPTKNRPQKTPYPRKNLDDPMFTLNFTAAKIRHDLSRMARKVWVTTKKKDRLLKHLFIFIAYHNQYELPL